jgi:hypothetical protein
MVSILGIPDIVGCCCGFFFAYELKMPGNKTTTLQDYMLRRIRIAMGRAKVLEPGDWPAELERLKEAAATGILTEEDYED